MTPSLSEDALTAIYTLVNPGGCVECSNTLENSFRTTFCRELNVGNCTLVSTECVKGSGLPADMRRIHFLPLRVVRQGLPCNTTQMAVQVLLDSDLNNVDTVIQLMSRPLPFDPYQVANPDPEEVGGRVRV